MGCGGGVPRSRRAGGGVDIPVRPVANENLFGLGSRLDFERCICGMPLGLLDRLVSEERFPVLVAPFSRDTSGFSIGQGRGILETQGVSGEGGAMAGAEGGARMPAATW